MIVGHFGRLFCYRGAPGNAVQIQPDVIRCTVHIAVLCRKAAQLIQRLFAHKGAQGGKADFDPLLLTLQKCFVQLLLLGQNELFRAELGPHLRDIAGLPEHGGQQPLFCRGNPQRLRAARTVRHADLVHLTGLQPCLILRPPALAVGALYCIGKLGHNGVLGDVRLLGQPPRVDLLLGGAGPLGQQVHRLLDVFQPLRVLGLFFTVAFTFMFFGNTTWPFYMQYMIGHSEWMASINLIGSIPGIFLVFLWPIVRRKIGKRAFFYAFLSLFIVGQLLLWIWSMPQFRDMIALGYVGRFFMQWGLTAATGYMWALVPEVIAYGEYQSKKRVAGIINSLMGLFFKIGLALGGIIPGYINAFFAFDGTKAAQSADALTGISISMIWLPILFALVSMWIISRYPLGDHEIDKINREIQARK